MNGQGGPPTSRNQLMIDIVNSAMLDSQRITTIRKLSDELGLLFGLVQSIRKEDMDMKHVSAKFVP
jgi:hypothetical protein